MRKHYEAIAGFKNGISVRNDKLLCSLLLHKQHDKRTGNGNIFQFFTQNRRRRRKNGFDYFEFAFGERMNAGNALTAQMA